MSKWFKIGITGLLLVGAMAAVLSGVAAAQDDDTTTTTPETTPSFRWEWGFFKGFGKGMGSQVGLEAAAEALGMSVDELTTQLWGGKTLADLAEEKGVDLADVKAAVEAAQEQSVRDAIEQAVTDGSLTREHADWLLEGLDKGFWSAGSGMRGFHRHGFHGFGELPSPTTTTPSGES